MLRILELFIVLLFVLWLIGLFFRLLGPLIHLALLVAIVLVIVRLVQGQKIV
jgi:hypothetical protein